MNDKKKPTKPVSDSFLHQLTVLNTLSSNLINPEEPPRYQIEEISQMSGLKDERETQRYLFILEGHKLVSPSPAGDFTSRTWHITKHGIRALKELEHVAA